MRICCVLIVAVAACSGPSKTAPGPSGAKSKKDAAPASPLRADAVAGVADPELANLLADHWNWRMEQAPVWASTLGDHRFDDRIGDGSAKAIAAARATTRKFLERARGIDATRLEPDDSITLALFIEQLDASIASEVCEFELWSISARGGPVGRFNYLPKQHKLKKPADGDNLLARYRAIPKAIDDEIDNLRRGAAKGLFANAETVRRAISMIDRQLAKPLQSWPLMEPAKAPPSGWPVARAKAFAGSLRTAVEKSIAPAYRRYRDLLKNEILPTARGPNKSGLVGLPNGEACYRARIKSFIGLPKTADELHRLGLAEIDRINREMRALATRLFGTDDLDSALVKLRTDPKLHFASRAEIVAAAKESLAAAKAAIPRWFGILPKADCTVVPIPDYEAPYTTIAYYRQPHYDGSKPGEYFINTYQPETRPRFEMQVLTFHESIPGHHLQIAIAQERGALPAFRKLGGSTAFVEGWALYTERLANEMGLYKSDLDRMGMLSYDAWRASRLVVDTGIHAKGWTRERAETFMQKHTALAKNNIVNEVDRYISWPGQALAYKVGQLEILRLRRQAEKALADRFDIKSFHDTVLRNGAVSLPVLARQVDAWVQSQAQAATPK
jgi:uncharacterized protein (DUF885 family)